MKGWGQRRQLVSMTGTEGPHARSRRFITPQQSGCWEMTARAARLLAVVPISCFKFPGDKESWWPPQQIQSWPKNVGTSVQVQVLGSSTSCYHPCDSGEALHHSVPELCALPIPPS